MTLLRFNSYKEGHWLNVPRKTIGWELGCLGPCFTEGPSFEEQAMAEANGGVITNQKGCAALLAPSWNVDFQGGGCDWFLITGFVFS